jgi:TolA-binding protein
VDKDDAELDKNDVKQKILMSVLAVVVGVSVGLAVGAGAEIFFPKSGSAGEAASLDRQAAAAKQDAERAISDLNGTVEQLRGTIGRLEARLRSERERAAALEEHQRKSRLIYQQLIEGNRGADADFEEAVRLVESLLAED